MTTPRFDLTESEHRRVARIDELVAIGDAGVPDLVAMLSDPSWTVRRAVVAGLAALGDDAVPMLVTWLQRARSSEAAIAAAVDALATSVGASATSAVSPLLEDATAAVAADAAHILGRRRAVEATPRLAHAINHADDNVAVAAIEALGTIGGALSVDALLTVLAQRSFFRTFPALQVLARTGSPRVVAAFASLLDDEMYRFEAARALGQTGLAQAVPALAKLILRANDDAALVRLVALALRDLIARAKWLGTIDHVNATILASFERALPAFTRTLRGSEPAERNAIAAVLGIIGDRSVVSELAAMLDDPASSAVAGEAMQRIARSHQDAVVDLLTSASPAARVAILPVVNTLRAAPTLRALLTDEDSEIRARTCEALARVGDKAAVPALFAELADPNPRVAYAATAAIHSLAAPDTEARTIAALKSGTTLVRRHALRIAAYLGFDSAFDVVSEAANDRDPRVAELAVAALAMMSTTRVARRLEELARDPREVIRAAVMRAATQRGGEPALALLQDGLRDDAAWVRYYACQGIGKLGGKTAVELVTARLADPAPYVRIAALEALGYLEGPAAWEALCSAVRSDNADEHRAALASMAMRPRAEALPFLLAGVNEGGSPTRLIALQGLALRSEPSAIEALSRSALDEDPEIQSAALSLLGERDDAEAAAALVDIALLRDADHPVQLALSRGGRARVAAIAARLINADDGAAARLIGALARMRDESATAALFAAATMDNPKVRRAVATALVAIDDTPARRVLARLAAEDTDLDVRRIAAAASGH